MLRTWSNLRNSLKHSSLTCNIESMRFLSSLYHHNITALFSTKYTEFRDEDSQVILDVMEERMKRQNDVGITNNSSSYEMKIQRSKDSVFTVQDLVRLVESNKAKNILAIKLPPELKYADYMVILSGSSHRHLNGLAELIRKEFKLKKNDGDPIPRIEGADSDWIALDLGNIAVHIMTESIRRVYDLESLWAIGPKYDLRLNTGEDQVLQILKQHTVNFDDLQPA